MVHSVPGSSVCGILQARKLVWVAIPFSRGPSWPRDQTHIYCILDEFITPWATNKQIAAATAAKSLQSCLTLRDPIDGSPPRLPSLQFSRQERWSGLPFPSPVHESEKWKVKVKLLSRVWLLATLWTAAHQAPPSMGFSRQEYWSGVPLPSPNRLEVLKNRNLRGYFKFQWFIE